MPTSTAAVDRVLAALVSPPPLARPGDVAAWWADHRAAAGDLVHPVDRAMVGAARVDRLGWAFAGAYQAALRAMLPPEVLAPGVRASFAVTEAGGNHPRAIEATLTADGDALRVDGSKAWVTLGPGAGVVIAVVRLALGGGGRPALRAVRLAADGPGVTITPHDAPAPFAPEIPHATARFDRAPIAAGDVLPGDGWDDWAKPFRTVEDAHVLAAALAHLAALGARHGWDRSAREALVAAALGARAVALADPRSPATHVALAGAFAAAEPLLAGRDDDWARVDAATRDAWRRDRPLLGVAARARARRRQRAWTALDG